MCNKPGFEHFYEWDSGLMTGRSPVFEAWGLRQVSTRPLYRQKKIVRKIISKVSGIDVRVKYWKRWNLVEVKSDRRHAEIFLRICILSAINAQGLYDFLKFEAYLVVL